MTDIQRQTKRNTERERGRGAKTNFIKPSAGR